MSIKAITGWIFLGAIAIATILVCGSGVTYDHATKNRIIFSEENLQGFHMNTLPPEEYRRQRDLITHPEHQYPHEYD